MRALRLLLPLLLVTTLFSQDAQKVVVIGFDGADAVLCEKLMEEGKLPNLSRLREMGGYSPLLPTNPPQTPVSWSTFATGINPGRTGIFDFIRRKEGSYIPDFALRGESREQVLLGENNALVIPAAAFTIIFLLFFAVFRKKGLGLKFALPLILAGITAGFLHHVFSQWIPPQIPSVVTVRQGTPIWRILEENGKTASIFRLPVTFPAEPVPGKMISGLAVPDIRGTVGKPSIYTNFPDWEAGNNQFSVAIYQLNGDGPYQTEILGPPNKFFYDPAAAEAARQADKSYDIPKDFHLPISMAVQGDQLALTIHDTTYTLSEKHWSDWIEFTYRINPIIKLKGAGRFYLDRLEGDRFKLYLTPIHLHPENPLPLSYPADLAKQVWQDEPYKTMGWALDTWSIGGSLMDEEHFLEDVDLTVTRYEKMMTSFLKDNDRDLFVQVFSFTDRVGHILWRYQDEGHHLNDPEKGAYYRQKLEETYIRMDGIVGKAMSMIDMDTTTLIVCSDHGFASWRYQFNFNTWLVKNGYMKLKKNVLGESMVLDDLQTATTPFTFVDWENTQAYALGLGMIFVNLEGREPEGSVSPEEYEALCRKLKEELEAYVDPNTGLNPVRRVHFRDDIYSQYNPKETPDLRVSTAPLYRVSWDTTLGGMPADTTSLNMQKWSGDHCSLDPEDVKGILFASKPILGGQPKMADMCPSILSLLGVKSDIDMDGQAIIETR